MNNDLFVNIALDTMLNKYESMIENKEEIDYKHFLLYVLKILAYIYGEENILDSFSSKDSRTFTYMLRKYNVDPYYVNKFYEDYDNYYKIDFRNKALNIREENPYYLYIQEDLINFYFAKYKALRFDFKKINKFKNMLYTNDNSDYEIIEYNKKMTKNPGYISDYFNSIMYGIKNNLELNLNRDSFISEEVYNSFNLTKEKRNKLSSRDINAIDNKIFTHFKVSPIDPNANKKILNEIKNNKKKYNSLTLKSKVTNYIKFAIIFLIAIFITIFIGLKLVGVLKWIK